MDLSQYGLNWHLNPKNKDSVVPADFLSKIAIASIPDVDTVITTIAGTSQTYKLGNFLGGGTFGRVFECSTPTNSNLVLKILKLDKHLLVENVIVETIIQIIVVEETRNESYPDFKLVGPFAPEILSVSYNPEHQECYIVSEKMRSTYRKLLSGWVTPKNAVLEPPKLIHTLININKVLEVLYNKLKFNHRDFKTDNCMYVRDASGNFMCRIIDFGFSCIIYKGLRISVGENQIPFRYCNLVGRDMSQMLYETFKHIIQTKIPKPFKDVIKALLTFRRGDKTVDILYGKTKLPKWGLTYNYMNNKEINPNCSFEVIHNVLTAFLDGQDWRSKLAYASKSNKMTKKNSKPVPEGAKPCPPEKPDRNPKTQRCVKACPPGTKRNSQFKCKMDCPAWQPDFNPKTKRCVKGCEPGMKRNSKFECVKAAEAKPEAKAEAKAAVKAKPCPPEKPDRNPKTKRCVKACPPGKKRDKDFKCVKTAKAKAKAKTKTKAKAKTKTKAKAKAKANAKAEPCPPEKPDRNPKTKRCVKACPPGKKRNPSFKCKRTKFRIGI